jgi:hypothetical protein
MIQKPIEQWTQEDLEYYTKPHNDGWSSMQLTKILLGLVTFTVFGIMGVKIIIQLGVIIDLLIRLQK